LLALPSILPSFWWQTLNFGGIFDDTFLLVLPSILPSFWWQTLNFGGIFDDSFSWQRHQNLL